MRKVLQISIILFALFNLFGCLTSSNAINNPDLPTTKQLRFSKIKFEFGKELHKPQIVYHTPAEIEKMINTKINTLLKDKNMLSSSTASNILQINVMYVRRYIGDETFAKSDTLASPDVRYYIYIYDNQDKLLKAFGNKNFGKNDSGIFGNLGSMFGSKEEGQDKQYEAEVANALAEQIVKDLENLIK